MQIDDLVLVAVSAALLALLCEVLINENES